MNTKLPKRCKNAALHGGKRLENCTEQTDKTTDCTTKPQTLPSWKVSQIILTVVNLLSEEGYFREGFGTKAYALFFQTHRRARPAA